MQYKNHSTTLCYSYSIKNASRRVVGYSMDISNYLEEYVTKGTLVICLFLCLFISNSIYLLFQIFQNSRPPSQKNIINTMYVLLSVIYQLINIFSCVSLIVKVWFPTLRTALANDTSMGCILMLARAHFTGIMFTTLAVISLLRYLKEFHFQYFQHLPEETIFLIILLCILPTLLTQTTIIIRCGGICNNEFVNSFFSNTQILQFECRSTPVLCLLAVTFTLIFICTVLQIGNLFFRDINILDSNIQILPFTVFFINNQVEPLENSPPFNTALTQNASEITFTFTTGFLTIILSSIGMFSTYFVTIIWTYFSKEFIPNNLVINQISSVIMTTILPIFWIFSNNELRDFSFRKVKNIFKN